MFCVVVVLLSISPFGTRRKHDGLIRFQLPSDPDLGPQVVDIMRDMTKRFVLVTMRDVAQGDVFDYAYQIKLHEPDDSVKLMRALEGISGIRGLTYTNHETTVEV